MRHNGRRARSGMRCVVEYLRIVTRLSRHVIYCYVCVVCIVVAVYLPFTNEFRAYRKP